MSTARLILLTIGFILFLVVGVWGGYFYTNTFSTKIVQNTLVVNEKNLKEYLGLNGIIPKTLRYKAPDRSDKKVTSLVFVRHEDWKETDDCIGVPGSGQRIFCFDERQDNRSLEINVYPDLDQIFQNDTETVNQLLNFNLVTILESLFEISKDKKVPVNIFRW